MGGLTDVMGVSELFNLFCIYGNVLKVFEIFDWGVNVCFLKSIFFFHFVLVAWLLGLMCIEILVLFVFVFH